MTWELALGIWGTITGTAAIAFQAIQHFQDRAHIELTPTHLFSSDIRNREGRLVFTVEVVNHGRRDIYLEDAGIEMPPPQNPEPGTWGHQSTLSIFPRQAGGSIHLSEGQKTRITLDPFPPEFVSHLGQTAVAFVKDTKGKIYKKSFQLTNPPDRGETEQGGSPNPLPPPAPEDW